VGCEEDERGDGPDVATRGSAIPRGIGCQVTGSGVRNDTHLSGRGNRRPRTHPLTSHHSTSRIKRVDGFTVEGEYHQSSYCISSHFPFTSRPAIEGECWISILPECSRLRIT